MSQMRHNQNGSAAAREGAFQMLGSVNGEALFRFFRELGRGFLRGITK